MHLHYHSDMDTLEVESTLTDRYQTTVPEPVRRALKLKKRDKIHYRVLPGGEVVLSRAEPIEEDDPVLARFLDFLASDLERNPGRVRGIDRSLLTRVRGLVKGVKVDLNAPLSPDDE